jgi:23S rRNA (uracil1939-C5)-methyltransferase
MTDAAEAGLLPLAHLPVDEQLATREERVRTAFRNARLTVDVLPIVPSPRSTGARARMRLRADGRGRLGFHRPGSHEWVQIPLDALARPELVAEAARIEAWAGARGALELRSDGERVVVVLEQAPVVAPPAGHMTVGGRTLVGDPVLQVGGLRVSPLSFYQVNLEINDAITAAVDQELARLAPNHLLDLYAGVGNLSARAVRRGQAATLIEQDRSSSSDARHNCRGARVVVADASRLRAGEHFFDVAILDPPRAGAPGVLPKLLVTRPRALVYLSCEPSTLARDLQPVVAAGYRVTRVQPYDMFPGTDHVETLVVVER